MRWTNEPSSWHADGAEIVLTTDLNTDFWQATYYGFRNDNGHFRHVPAVDDFTAEVIVQADYSAQYDQAGLMIRYSAEHWLKAGVELAGRRCTLGSVLTTAGCSDWAVGPDVSADMPLRLRLARKDGAVCVQFATELRAPDFRTLRLGPIAPSGGDVGVFACTPTRAGLVAPFNDFRVSAPVDFAAEV